MLIEFFLKLKQGGVPVSINEFLTLLEALEKRVIGGSIDEFYYLSRACLVKDETNYDKFDRVFAAYFKGIIELSDGLVAQIPEEWLKKLAEKHADRGREEADRVARRLGQADGDAEASASKSRRAATRAASKWIGTAGTSPVRRLRLQPRRRAHRPGRSRATAARSRSGTSANSGISTTRSSSARATSRSRCGGCASSRARAHPEELDLDDTIRSTAKNAGWLDIKMVPERHNAVKVLLFLDVGGSMDDHIRICEQLFSAARTEFKHLEYFYFHNFLYERVWKDNRRRATERMATWDVLHKYPHDYKVIFVGDATMSPYEITYPGGSVEHTNEEAGAVWLQRMLAVYHEHGLAQSAARGACGTTTSRSASRAS